MDPFPAPNTHARTHTPLSTQPWRQWGSVTELVSLLSCFSAVFSGPLWFQHSKINHKHGPNPISHDPTMHLQLFPHAWSRCNMLYFIPSVCVRERTFTDSWCLLQCCILLKVWEVTESRFLMRISGLFPCAWAVFMLHVQVSCFISVNLHTYWFVFVFNLHMTN